MSSIWFTSDLHFYHNNVIRYCDRPYISVEEMNEKLIANWNNTVKPEDTIYCMGDLSLAIRPVELFSNRLIGNKKLVPGNHDWCHPANKKAKGERLSNWIKHYENFGWEILPLHSELNIEGVSTVNMSHMPYKGDTTDTRHENYRLIDDGRVLICGHVHEKWKTKVTPNGTLMINVGVDVWNYIPVSLTEITQLIGEHK